MNIGLLNLAFQSKLEIYSVYYNNFKSRNRILNRSQNWIRNEVVLLIFINNPHFRSRSWEAIYDEKRVYPSGTCNEDSYFQIYLNSNILLHEISISGKRSMRYCFKLIYLHFCMLQTNNPCTIKILQLTIDFWFLR